MKDAQAHLELATKARSYLKSQVESSKAAIKEHFTDKGLAVPAVGACVAAKSNNITIHFSFAILLLVCNVSAYAN